MRLKFLFADGSKFYAIRPDGDLLIWSTSVQKVYPQSEAMQDPYVPQWGQPIGTEWSQFIHVFSGGNGVIYAIKPGGELLWYKDTIGGDPNATSERWATNSGNQIGVDWQQFTHVLGGGNGIIYAIKPTGELYWYRDDLRDGTNDPQGQRGWDVNSGKQIGYEWDQFSFVVYGGNGSIYGVKPTGELRWYRDTARDGTNGPQAANGTKGPGGPQPPVSYVRITPNHPFLAHVATPAFGDDGYNGLACGWECDYLDGVGAGVTQLAGQSFDVANMVTFDTNGGSGFVFSVGSIAFGGCLPVRGDASIVAKNVLNESLRRSSKLLKVKINRAEMPLSSG